MAGKKKKKRKQTGLKVFLVVLILFLTVTAALLTLKYIFSFDVDVFTGENGIFRDLFDSDEERKKQIDTLEELRSDGDLYTLLKNWATTDTGNSLMQRDDVINVLVAGLDATAEHSDALLIVSLNKTEQKIYLSSIMRDCYTYISTGSIQTAAKINAAYVNGGINCLIDTVQNDYKIKIDHYVTVNFNTFVEVVDALGGVTLPVKYYEMEAINGLADDEGLEHLYDYGDEVLLDGTQALLYCRIRYCDADGDISRTRRQRQFIAALAEKVENISLAELPGLVQTLKQYVKTDCSAAEIISLGTQALTGRWHRYELVSTGFPLEENRMDYNGSAWVWIVDFPADARALQKLIYGESNIKLSEDRQSAIDLVRSGESSPD